MAALTQAAEVRLHALQPEQHRFHAAGFQLAGQLLSQRGEFLRGCVRIGLPLCPPEPRQTLVIDKYLAVAEAQLLQRGHALHEPRGRSANGLSHLAHRQPRGSARCQKAAANPVGASRHALFDPQQQGRVDCSSGNGILIVPGNVLRHRHQLRAVALPGLRRCLDVRPQAEPTQLVASRIVRVLLIDQLGHGQHGPS